MERRGRIPIATFRNIDGKTRSRSRVRDPNYNKSEPDTDLFTLLEDNIALREENDSLTTKNNSYLQEKDLLEKENIELKSKIRDINTQQVSLQSQIDEISFSLNKATEENIGLKESLKMEKNKQFQSKINEQELKANDYLRILKANKKIKEQIDKLIPSRNTNDYDSLGETENSSTNLDVVECIQKLLTEFSRMKTTLGNTELQLYEANEKIAELIENQNNLEDEIETLRLENSNLTRVAELITTNMKESVSTSKKMEDALIEMKRKNDVLSIRTLDSLDSPITNKTVNEEIVRLRDEITKRDLAHGERIVEMKKLMDTTIENTSNEEIKLLNIKLELIEKELKQAILRAEKAEMEVQKLKLKQESQKFDDDKNLKNQNNLQTLPPPLPPPMPNFSYPTNKYNLKNVQSLNTSITSCTLKSGSSDPSRCYDNTSNNILRKQQINSTGLDALVREFKDGNVTLRRARRKTRTNDALQEMFEVLEISRKQNRNSKMFIENHINNFNNNKKD